MATALQDEPALRAKLLSSLPAQWVIEGPMVAYTGYGACLRARSTNSDAPYADIAGVSAWGEDVSSAYSRLSERLNRPRSRVRRPRRLNHPYRSWRAESIFTEELPADVDEVSLRKAWEIARSALLPGWEMASVQIMIDPYSRRRRWVALASAPYMYVESDTHYVHRAGWGDDPISAFENLAVVLGGIKPTDFVG